MRWKHNSESSSNGVLFGPALDVPEQNLAELLEAQIRKSPSLEAVRFQDRAVTFKELGVLIDSYAALLAARGVREGDVISTLIPRGIEHVAIAFAIWKLGAVYQPIDILYPPERCRDILQDARPRLVVVSGRRDTGEWGEDIPRVALEDASFQAVAPPKPGVARLAYILYTSGSTGKPKGVSILHSSLTNLVYAHKSAIYDKVTHGRLNATLNTSFCFDGSFERMSLLIFGHTLHVTSEEERHDPKALIKSMAKNRINVLDTTPVFLSLLIEGGLFTLVPDLRLVICGGEAVNARLWSELQKARSCHTFNVYGPTEATINASIAHVNDSSPSPNIGRPLANMGICLLGPDHRVTVLGEGEIGIFGFGLSSGYLNPKQDAAPKFVQVEILPGVFERVYLTGDIGRIREDGDLEYLDRIDNQIKIRGHRVELGEIEKRILDAGNVDQIALKFVKERNILVGFFCSHSKLAPKAVKDALASQLPDYMIPHHFVRLDNIPLNSNGKVDWKRLEVPDVFENESGEPTQGPANDLERTLIEKWEALLMVKPISRGESFFDLGGDSIKAIEFIGDMNANLFGKDDVLGIEDILLNPVLKDLAAALMEKKRAHVAGA